MSDLFDEAKRVRPDRPSSHYPKLPEAVDHVVRSLVLWEDGVRAQPTVSTDPRSLTEGAVECKSCFFVETSFLTESPDGVTETDRTPPIELPPCGSVPAPDSF